MLEGVAGRLDHPESLHDAPRPGVPRGCDADDLPQTDAIEPIPHDRPRGLRGVAFPPVRPVLAAAVAKIELDLSGGGKVIALPVRAVAG